MLIISEKGWQEIKETIPPRWTLAKRANFRISSNLALQGLERFLQASPATQVGALGGTAAVLGDLAYRAYVTKQNPLSFPPQAVNNKTLATAEYLLPKMVAGMSAGVCMRSAFNLIEK